MEKYLIAIIVIALFAVIIAFGLFHSKKKTTNS